MSNHLLEQFRIKNVININFGGYDISITNSVVFMMVAVSFITLFIMVFLRTENGIIPKRFAMSVELLYQVVCDMMGRSLSVSEKKFFPLIFTLFIFILTCNLLGIIPYSFTVTSQVSFTFTIAIVLFTIINFVGFYLHGRRFLSLFVPHGVSLWIAPLMIIIELFAYLLRPISLSLRLAINMIAGHILLKVLAGVVISSVVYLKILPASFIVLAIAFEFGIAMLQAYIFSLLSCIYIEEVVSLR